MAHVTSPVQVRPLPEGHDWLWIEPVTGEPVLLLAPGSATFKAVRAALEAAKDVA